MNLSPYLDLRINQELDRNLIPCPVCHNKYNDPHKHRKGPTCLPKFEGDKVHIICLSCWTIGEPAKDQHGANDNWNAGRLAYKDREDNPYRKRRLALGLTQKQLAQRAGLGSSTITSIENGYYDMGDVTRLKVERALGMRV